MGSTPPERWCCAANSSAARLIRAGVYNERSQPILLDLGKPSPNAVFTVVIYGIDRAKFGTPENPLRGEQICVTGLISAYQGKPVIVLIDPSQLSQ